MPFSKAHKVLFIAVIAVCLFVIAPTAVSAQTDTPTIERTIEDTELQPGETTEVTVEITTAQEQGPFVTETFSSAFSDVYIVSDSPRSQIAGPNDANTEFTAGWSADGTAYSITYEVAVPENAEFGSSFNFSGTTTIGDSDYDITGDDSISIEKRQTVYGERTIEQGRLIPGQKTTVTVDINLPEEGSPSLTETFEQPFSDGSVVETTPRATQAGVNNANTEIISQWSDIQQNYTLVYQVKMPQNATPGEAYSISGSVTDVNADNGASGEITGATDITVRERPDGPADYANPETGEVDSQGLTSAFSDWKTAGVGSKTLSEVFNAWKSGNSVT